MARANATLTADGWLVQEIIPPALPTYHVSLYGARCDGKYLTDAVCTNGSAVVTSATGDFSSADVGKLFVIMPRTGAGSQTRMRGTIASVQSATQFTAAAASGVSITGGGLTYGTNDATAIDAAIAAATAKGGTVFFPAGCSVTNKQHVVPGGVRFKGVGRDYCSVHDVPMRGSTLALIGFLTGKAVVKLGDNQVDFDSGDTIACIEDMNVDAINGTDRAVETYGRRCRVERCTIWRGNGAAGYNGGPDSWWIGNILGQQNDDTVLDSRTGDAHFYDNVLRQAGNGATTEAPFRSVNSTNVIYRGNHHFRGGGGESLSSSYQGPGVLIRSTGSDGVHSNIKIDLNDFDGTYGPHVMVKVGESAATELRALSISHNTMFQSGGFPASTYPVVQFVPESGSTIFAKVHGNEGIGALPHPVTAGYTYIATNTGAGTVVAQVTDNDIHDCADFWSGFTPTHDHGNRITAVGSSTPVCSGEFTTEVTVTTGELLALNATPKTLIAAPGAGRALIFLGAQIWYDYNSAAYAGIAGTEELAIRYTGTAGAIVGTCEPTGFLDQTADETRWVYPLSPNTAPDTSIEPPANAPLVLHMTVGEITTGNSPLKIRIRARMIGTSW